MTITTPSLNSTNLLDITLHDENYLRAIDIINSLVDHYNKYGNEQKDESVRRNEEFVNSRLAKLDTELGTSDANWENYKRSHDILDPDAAASEATEKKNEYEEQIKEIDLDILLHDYQSDFIKSFLQKPLKQKVVTMSKRVTLTLIVTMIWLRSVMIY